MGLMINDFILFFFNIFYVVLSIPIEHTLHGHCTGCNMLHFYSGENNSFHATIIEVFCFLYIFPNTRIKYVQYTVENTTSPPSKLLPQTQNDGGTEDVVNQRSIILVVGVNVSSIKTVLVPIELFLFLSIPKTQFSQRYAHHIQSMRFHRDRISIFHSSECIKIFQWYNPGK